MTSFIIYLRGAGSLILAYWLWANWGDIAARMHALPTVDLVLLLVLLAIAGEWVTGAGEGPTR